MSLVSRIEALVTRIAAEFKGLRAKWEIGTIDLWQVNGLWDELEQRAYLEDLRNTAVSFADLKGLPSENAHLLEIFDAKADVDHGHAFAALIDGTQLVQTILGQSLLNSGAGSVITWTVDPVTRVVTSSYATTPSLADGSVTLAKLADITANTMMGNLTPSDGPVLLYTAGQVRAFLNVANGATVNSPDATLLDRANHTGTQLAATISDFNSAADARITAAGLVPPEMFAGWYGLPGQTSAGLVKSVAFAATGTATAYTLASTNGLTSRPRLSFRVTVAAATAVAGWRFSGAGWWRGNAANLGGFKFTCIWANDTGGATATHRAFVGMANTTSAPTDVQPSTLVNMLGMGWDAADTNVQMMHNDASGAATKIDLGANFPVPTADAQGYYKIEITCASNGADFAYTITNLVNSEVATGTISTDMPANTVFMAPRGWMSVGGTSSVIGISMLETELTRINY